VNNKSRSPFTNNEREFQRVPGLTVVNWAAGG